MLNYPLINHLIIPYQHGNKMANAPHFRRHCVTGGMDCLCFKSSGKIVKIHRKPWNMVKKNRDSIIQ